MDEMDLILWRKKKKKLFVPGAHPSAVIRVSVHLNNVIPLPRFSNSRNALVLAPFYFVIWGHPLFDLFRFSHWRLTEAMTHHFSESIEFFFSLPLKCGLPKKKKKNHHYESFILLAAFLRLQPILKSPKCVSSCPFSGLFSHPYHGR